MGHARTYLGFDIIRRILSYHFKYDVTLIMNITDIDDKIIQRSAENNVHHLELSQKFEQEFHEDMAALGVMPPSVLTRVTEYMPQIVSYIQTICDKELAYESNGSVYFDTVAFEETPNMHLCKLEPEQKNNADLLAQGEGSLSQDFVSDKKNPRDFALWKKSKEGEPTWESPWGPGRPGWHIECSVMASDVLKKMFGGDCMDIHSGGVDLKFPHHDNEMAQAEAECGSSQWVNYFVHAGHLHIKGFKMSKSLKNFITIQQALENNSARQIRLLFLMHKYNAPMDYGDDTMRHAVVAEKLFVEFFHNVKACLRQHGISELQTWSTDAIELQKTLSGTMLKVDNALKDDFDTPNTVSLLINLVRATNLYLESDSVVGLVVRNVASYITSMFKMFGLIFDDSIGFPEGAGGGGAASREQVLGPVLDALMKFRSNVREKARSNDIDAVMGLCDDFRDKLLPPLGIRLEDKTDGSVWKLADPEELVKEMMQKELEAQRKAQEKAERAQEEAKKDALNKLTPEEFMKQLTSEDGVTLMYTKFDDAGLPTHDSTGEPLSQSQVKKIQKAFQAQQKKYDKYMKQQG
jgi:cysteinyl-tRNA synthetase